MHLIELWYGWKTKLLYQSPRRWHKFLTTAHTGEQLSFEVFVYLVGGFQFFRVDGWHRMAQRQDPSTRTPWPLLVTFAGFMIGNLWADRLAPSHSNRAIPGMFSIHKEMTCAYGVAGCVFLRLSSSGDQWQGHVFGVEPLECHEGPFASTPSLNALQTSTSKDG